MKTIFYGQNQLNISKKIKSGFLPVYDNPNAVELKFIIDLFLNSKNYEGLIVGDTKTILKNIKKHFIFIKAAGGLVLNRNKEVLLIKRLGKWDLPKGKLEANETKVQGAVREVEEECGINGLTSMAILKPSYHVYFEKKGFVLKTTYWFLMEYNNNEKLKPQLEENITEAIWVHPQNIDFEKFDTYPAIAKVLRQSQLLSE